MKKYHEGFEKAGYTPVFISSESIMTLFIKGFILCIAKFLFMMTM